MHNYSLDDTVVSFLDSVQDLGIRFSSDLNFAEKISPAFKALEFCSKNS